MPRIAIRGAVNGGHAYSSTTITEITTRRDASGNVENTFRQVQHNSGATPQQYQPAMNYHQQQALNYQPVSEPNPAAYGQARVASRVQAQLPAPPAQGMLEYHPTRDQFQSERRVSQGHLGRSRSVRAPDQGYILEQAQPAGYAPPHRSRPVREQPQGYLPPQQGPPEQYIPRQASIRGSQRQQGPSAAYAPRQASLRESQRVYIPQYQPQPAQYVPQRAQSQSRGRAQYAPDDVPSRSRAPSQGPILEPARQLHPVRQSSTRRSERR